MIQIRHKHVGIKVEQIKYCHFQILGAAEVKRHFDQSLPLSLSLGVCETLGVFEKAKHKENTLKEREHCLHQQSC